MGILTIVIACVLSGILYRMGGSGNYPRQIRVIGCPLVALGLVLLTNHHSVNILGWVMLMLSFGLSIGAISTYWDFLFHDKDNFYMHGFAIGVSGLTLIGVVPLPYLLIRIVICSVGMGLWSKWIGWDIAEEFGRGVLFIL